LRILLISNYYPPYEVGGYEQLCRDVAARLSDRGHLIQVLTSDHGLDGRSQPAAPDVHRLLDISPDYGARLGPAWQFVFARRQAEAHNRECLRSLAQQFQPEVICIWNLQGLPRSLAVEAESLSGVGVAYWLAGYSPAEPDEYWLYWSTPATNLTIKSIKQLFSSLALAIMRSEGQPIHPQMRHVAVVSEFMRKKGIADGTLPNYAQVIYNGVEIEHFCRPVQIDLDGPLNLLQAGRVSEDKGVHTAVEAIGRLARDYQIRNVHLYVAGSGPAAYQASLQQIVQQYGIEEMVSFLGWLPRDAMPELMAKCQVLLLPTVHQEPFARVVLEAMASGLAVVGTLTGGTGELLQQDATGLSFVTSDSEDLARQIRRLVLDPGLRFRLATQGQQFVCARFDLEHMVDAIEGLLDEARVDAGSSK
jgi:glycosyltransferase involved in cell wall biosynthesis